MNAPDRKLKLRPAATTPERGVGARTPLVDGIEKVTGTARYTADLPANGALVGKILRSPYAHAELLEVKQFIGESFHMLPVIQICAVLHSRPNGGCLPACRGIAVPSAPTPIGAAPGPVECRLRRISRFPPHARRFQHHHPVRCQAAF